MSAFRLTKPTRTEWLVVVAIVATLAALIIPALRHSSSRHAPELEGPTTSTASP